ncbi:hypothetical protein FRACA_80028 [Frankia canadensis]|uniref:Uncharacterized protein n=1 Tax=Frankia canadensis TaxID=1836972 RepID=A0A2I2L1E3_9ACTN|nr:hypothetical protein FRACA_80028 [Frankia canadensis]SOU59018.1 hypothetical protein FRACA_80028 [Frankia canadensis]
MVCMGDGGAAALARGTTERAGGGTAARAVTRTDVLAYRVRAQQLDGAATALADAAALDFGVQDTGPDGGLWALAVRGVNVADLSGDELAARACGPQTGGRVPRFPRQGGPGASPRSARSRSPISTLTTDDSRRRPTGDA